MDYQLLMELSTVLSVAALAIGALAACGAFKSRRQREVEARLKAAVRQHGQTQRAGR